MPFSAIIPITPSTEFSVPTTREVKVHSIITDFDTQKIVFAYTVFTYKVVADVKTEITRFRKTDALTADNTIRVDAQGNYLPSGSTAGIGEYDFYLSLFETGLGDTEQVLHQVVTRADNNHKFDII